MVSDVFSVSAADLNGLSGIASFLLLAGWIVRTWPHWKAKINEARKIELDHDNIQMEALLARIRFLEETQSADRQLFNKELSDERRRCDEALDALRARQTALEDDNRSLQAIIRQNSSSTAQMIGRPGDVALSRAAKQARENKEK